MHHNETYGIMKNNNRLMVLMLITSTMLLFQNCKNSTTPQNAATSLEQIKEADQQNDYTRILHLADSLGATGELKEGASYYWQGYAYYRMKQRHTAEFYWREAIEIGLTVARSLVRRMGGEITLDTSYKTGARFVMELPIA